VRSNLSIGIVTIGAFAAIGGMLLLAGLWTPVVGVVAALIEGSAAYVSHPHDPSTFVLLAVLAVSLSLLGPGAYSVDARLFGWKRIDVEDRKG